MTTYYCDDSLTTGLNDGSTLANAWQSATNVFANTQTPALVAGDTVNFRTHDGTSDIEITGLSSTDMFNGVGDAQNPLTAIFDDGTVWPQGGQFLMETSSSFTSVNVRSYVKIIAKEIGGVKTLRFSSARNNDLTPWVKFYMGSYCENLHIEPKTAGTTYLRSLCLGWPESNTTSRDNGGGLAIIKDCFIKMKGEKQFFDSSSVGMTYGRVINSVLDFEFHDSSGYIADTDVVLGASTASAKKAILEFINCKVVNAIESQKISKNGIIYAENTDFGLLKIAPNYDSVSDATSLINNIVLSGTPGNSYYYSQEKETGYVQFEPAGNYPTLLSVLPDATPWAMKLWINPNASNLGEFFPFEVPTIKKVSTSATGVKTITLEILIHNGITSPLDNEFWIECGYHDNLSDVNYESSKGTGITLTTSTADWSSTTYGANTYVKYKIELTTAKSVKIDTIITCNLKITRSSSAEDEFSFLDPTVYLS